MADKVSEHACDFCGKVFQWTAEQVHLDLQLRLCGSGLGACCSDCDDKMIAIELRNMAEEDARIAAEEADGA